MIHPGDRCRTRRPGSLDRAREGPHCGATASGRGTCVPPVAARGDTCSGATSRSAGPPQPWSTSPRSQAPGGRSALRTSAGTRPRCAAAGAGTGRPDAGRRRGAKDLAPRRVTDVPREARPHRPAPLQLHQGPHREPLHHALHRRPDEALGASAGHGVGDAAPLALKRPRRRGSGAERHLMYRPEVREARRRVGGGADDRARCPVAREVLVPLGRRAGVTAREEQDGEHREAGSHGRRVPTVAGYPRSPGTHRRRWRSGRCGP